jgi:hypothetical protein
VLNRSRSAILALAAGTVLTFALAGGALAAANPSGTGRPGAECGEPGATVEPAGFLKPGFAIAESHYNPGSQYDVACFQVTSSH